jgi:hypothetical protein
LAMLQVLVSGLVTMALYGAVVLGVVKIFQIATELGEIKDALLEIKRNTLDIPPAALASLSSTGRLAGAVSAQAYPSVSVDTQKDHVDAQRVDTDPVESPR